MEPMGAGDGQRVGVNMHSPPEAKVELFLSLFRGRDDVWGRRFESSRTGKSGYSPVCANEWARGVCDKRKVKCAACPNRRFLPVTEEVVAGHLRGVDEAGKELVMGVYLMLADETCFFLAVDFEKTNYFGICENCHAQSACGGVFASASREFASLVMPIRDSHVMDA